MEITLKACRINAGLKQSELAKELGVSLLTVSNWELGYSEPSLSQLRKISELSGVDMNFIVLTKEKARLS